MELETLPEAVTSLPKDAQGIWLSIFNSTFRTFSGTDEEKEEASKIAAWAAVRSKFQRTDRGKWEVKSQMSIDDLNPVRGHWTRSVKFVTNMIDAKKRITYGEVYRPWEVDAQGDFASEETIEEAAHKFLKRSRKIGEQHEDWAGKGIPVESWLTRAGDSEFPIPGTWVLGTQWSEEMWSKILNGEKTGYSLGGEWTRVPVVAGREFAKRVLARKSADEPMVAELDTDLFEQPSHKGPRIISQIIGLDVDEVSGVDMPANRQPFKLFKSSRTRRKDEAGKAPPTANPWVKLYLNYIESGMSEEDAIMEVERVLGPAPPGTWDQIKDAMDDCVSAKMGDPDFQAEFPDPEQRIAVAISMCEEGKDSTVKKKQTEEPMEEQAAGVSALSFEDAIAQIDSAVGPGNGLPLASLIQAKWAAGPEGGIALPDGMTLEQALQWALDQGIVELKQAEDGQLTILKRLEREIKSLFKKLGGKAEDQPETEDEAMTAEERKELDALKTQVGDIGTALGEIKSLLANGKKESCSCQDKEQPKIGEDGKEIEAQDEETYIPTAEQTGSDLLELAEAVKEIAVEVKALKSRPGVSAIPGAINVRDGVKNEGGGDMVYSEIVGAYIPKSAREAEVKRVRADMDRRRANRPRNPRMQLRMGK